MRKVYTNFNKLPAVLTPQQCAEVLFVDEHTVTRLCRSGQLTARKIGKLWRIDKEMLQKFLRNEAEVIK